MANRENKLKIKPYLTNSNLLMVQDLRQAHQMLQTILLKGLIKLNANMDIIKNVKHVELNTKITVLNAHVKDDLILHKCLCYNRNYQTKFDTDLKKQFS